MVLRIASQRALALSAASRLPLVAPAQARACHLCRSVKEWKENHGAWSRNPKQSAALSATASQQQQRTVGPQGQQLRAYASAGGKSAADERIEEITEAFNTAKDELELATEETEKKTVYAEADREAANEELKNVLKVFAEAIEASPPEVGQEIRNRVGARIKELEQGFKRLEEMAMED